MPKETEDTLSRYQRIAADAYDDGAHSHVTSIEDAREVGDTLFVFLMAELAESEDCEDLDTAIRRVETAINQLTEVRAALEQAA